MSYEELAQQMVDLHTEHYSEMTQIAREMGTGGEGIILHLLLTAHGDVFAEDLAHKTGLSAGRVASILKKLEEQGAITRTRSSQNRRKYLIELTSAGKKAARKSDQATLESHERVLRGLGQEDAQNLLRIISRLCNIYQEQNG